MIRDYAVTKAFSVALFLTGAVSSPIFAQFPGVQASNQAVQAAVQAAIDQARNRMKDTSYIGAAQRTTRSRMPGTCAQRVDSNGRISYRCP